MKTAVRVDWIDHAKAIGICLVVLGHTTGLPEFAVRSIYSFHMPLFFFISGYLLKAAHLSQPLWTTLKRQARTLLIPYISFWVISYFYWLITSNFVLDSSKYVGITFLDLVIGFLFGTGDPEHTLIIINVDLWFFTCLFVTSMYFVLLSRKFRGNLLIAIVVLIGGFAPLIPQILGARLPWNLELAGVALVFYGMGHLLQTEAMPEKKTLGWMIATALPIWILVVRQNGWVDMNTMQFGRLWLFYVGAGLGIFLTLAISHFFPQNQVSRWLSENTIIIFPLHQLMFSVFNGLAVRVIGLPVDFKTTLTSSIVYSTLALLCSIPVTYIIRHYLPFIVGGRKTSRVESPLNHP